MKDINRSTIRHFLTTVVALLFVFWILRVNAVENEARELRERVAELERRADQTDTTMSDIGIQYDSIMDELQMVVYPRLDDILYQLTILETTSEAVGEVEVIETEGTLTRSAGVNWYGEQKETWYNLPMYGVVAIAHSNGIEGEYWERDDGCKMYGDYIILAANHSVHPYGSTVKTSLGDGIVLDSGGFAYGNPYQVDIAVNW